jgi:hypothetical protein
MNRKGVPYTSITYYIYYQTLYACPYSLWFGESVNKFGISSAIPSSLDSRALLFSGSGKKTATHVGEANGFQSFAFLSTP